ncbi:MAG TPA: alginate lyase family protein [Solirubrobacteraceae bacterium]|nr:alginate lyase family protein [Solirubrobacteraceae bacterium]
MLTAQIAAPNPVLCVTAHEHRDRDRAEAVAAGRFTHNGETRELGTEPDWLHADLPADEEWRIDWVKFAYGLDLAHAYRTTGEERFKTTWERLVGSYIKTVPADHDAAEVTARRILNWIYAWQEFGELSPGHAARLLGSIGDQTAHVRENLAPERNHRTLELYALLITALALPLPDDGLLDFAIAELETNLHNDFRADGVHIEASTHYHCIALRSFVGARENCRGYGFQLSAEFDARLAKALDFAVHCRRPDGLIPMLSDADTGDYAELLALAGDPQPTALNADFPHGGYYTQRSGWGPDDAFLIFDCGPLGDGGHGHYDLLSVEAYAHGRLLLVDPGRFTYDEGPPNLRHWFRGTAAHNTVTVDGRDQTPYTRKRPDGPTAEGRFLGRTSAPGIDVLAGEARSPVYDALHQRRITFVHGRSWVIEDRLRGETEHEYDLRYHLAPGDAVIDGETVRAAGLTLHLAGAAQIRLEPGWIAPEYGTRIEAPVVSAKQWGRDATFTTIVVPEP